MQTFKATILITTDDETDAGYVKRVVEDLFDYNGSEHVTFESIKSVKKIGPHNGSGGLCWCGQSH